MAGLCTARSCAVRMPMRASAPSTSAGLALPGQSRRDQCGPATAEDRTIQLGEGAVNLKYLSNNILAGDKVLYKGAPVAAVAATSPHLAEEALALIHVDYEVLPPVLDVREAMQDSAPCCMRA